MGKGDQVRGHQTRVTASLLRRRIKIFQIRSRLVPPCRHQVTVCAKVVHLLADGDAIIALAAIIFGPDRLVLTTVVLRHSPRAGQRMIYGSDLVVKDVGIYFVEINPLIDDGLIVLMHRNAGVVEDPRPPKVAGFDFEQS